jgi:hypothetical protein
LSRLTPDEVRDLFEPILLREARDRLDHLIEVCRILDAEPSSDVVDLRARLTAALGKRASVQAK